MIDTSIQINNHNSYHATEDFWQKPFGVELMEYITIAAAFYATSPQLEADRIRVIFYDDNGARLQVSDHGVAIGIVWERKSVTVAVPAGAKLAQVAFLSGNYWWAEAKAEEGQTATPYAVNAAGQLTYMTPNGVYTHTVQAKQIIVTDSESLEDKLVTINQNHLSLVNRVKDEEDRVTLIEAGMVRLGTVYNGVEIDQEKGLEINSLIDGKSVKIKLNTDEGLAYYSGGTFKGGLKVVDDELAMVSNVVSNDSTLKAYASLGKTGSLQGLRIYDLNVQSRPMISMEAMFDGGVYFQDHQGTVLSRSVLGVVNLIATGSGGALSLYPPNAVGAYGGGFVLGNATNGGILGRSNGNIEIGKMLTVGSLQIGTRQLTASGDDLYWNGKKVLTA